MIRDRLKTFLAQELSLELSEAKTLITHANTQKARFLGYDISVTQCDTKIGGNRRSVNGGIALRMPASFVAERSRFYMRDGKAIHRMERTHSSDYSIVCQYQAEYRGFVQYYQLADNIAWLNWLHWVMRMSLLKTLANKHQSTVAKMVRRFAAKVVTPYGPRTCLEDQVPREGKEPLIARFGGLPLRTNLTAYIEDRPPCPQASRRDRAASAASGERVRGVWLHGERGSPSRPQARRPEPSGKEVAARLGATHGIEAEEDAGPLSRLS